MDKITINMDTVRLGSSMSHVNRFITSAHAMDKQTRHNFVGEIRIFSVKIRINPYQSVSFIYASMYRGNVHAIHIVMKFAQKSRHCVIKIDSQQQRTKIGTLLHVARPSD